MERLLSMVILFSTLMVSLGLWCIDEHLKQIRDLLGKEGEKNERH